MKEYNKGTSIGCVIGATTGLVFSIIVMLIISQGHSIKYPIELWYFAQDWLAAVYPLLCSVPFCWETFYQRKSGYLQYVANRKSPPGYLIQRYFFSLGQVIVLIFVVSFFSAVVALHLISPAHPSEQSFMQYEAWGEMIINSPIQYVLLLSAWRVIPSCLIYSLGYVLAVFGKNILIVLTGPFVYSIVENFAFSAINAPYLSLITSFFPGRLSADSITPARMLAGPATLFVIIAAIFLSKYVRHRKGPSRCSGIQ